MLPYDCYSVEIPVPMFVYSWKKSIKKNVQNEEFQIMKKFS